MARKASGTADLISVRRYRFHEKLAVLEQFLSLFNLAAGPFSLLGLGSYFQYGAYGMIGAAFS